MRDLTRLLPHSASPLVTHYDTGTGERTELSGITLANWAAKTANFLTLDLDAGPGTTLRLALPTHWLRFVWLAAAWQCGVTISDEPGTDIAVTGPEGEASEPVAVACSLLPFARPLADLPEGFLDMSTEVLAHADQFTAFEPPTAETVATHLGGRTRTHAEVLAATTDLSDRLILTPGELARDAHAFVSVCRGQGSIVTVVADAHGGLPELALVERIGEQEQTLGDATYTSTL